MVTPLRMKIAKEKVTEGDAFSVITKRSAGACSDYHQIDPKNVSYKFDPKPWDRPPAKTYVSKTVTQGMKKALMAHVPGLGNTTIQDVLDTLNRHGCICLPFGGSVRDQFLGGEALDIDADTPCPLKRVVNICKKFWDAKYCKAPSKKATLQIVHIGEMNGKEMDLANWNNTFFGSLTNLEYTTNSLAYYDNGTNISVLVDLSGSGVEDTCNKTIKPTVPYEQWQSWYNNDSYKIFRYWKLRAKGYTAKDKALPLFIKNTTQKILSTVPGVKLFKQLFCKYAFNGQYGPQPKTCTIQRPACANTMELRQKRNKYYELYYEVLGEFWENEAKAMLDEVEVRCPSTSTSTPKTKSSLAMIAIGIVIQRWNLFFV